ncbi:mannose-binding protein C-like [Drosophila biarmipes]|uniref:mannose-binding protein C-like n=1 Tax=Drosophila biarmipes TaxID=125945 RepID=UPI0007E7E6EB|nr:mannose-binding protein C-like [Drosophila biarmipes]
MFKSPSYLLRFLAILALQGSWAATQDNGPSGSLLQDSQAQRGPFCLSALHPIQAKLASIEGKQDVLQTKLLAVQSRLEAERLSLQSKLDDTLLAVQTEMKELHAKIVASVLQAVQEKLDDHKAVIQASLEKGIPREDLGDRVNGTELATLEKHLLTLQNQSETHQNTLVETLSKINSRIVPPKFERIGSRYFYIEQHLFQNWTAATETCRQVGGYLAAFRDEEEFNAIVGKLQKYEHYLLGINDMAREDEFVSVASGRPAPFFKWRRDYPNTYGDRTDCVILETGVMRDYICTDRSHFICQWDNEV